jgi:hypothetical protein
MNYTDQRSCCRLSVTFAEQPAILPQSPLEEDPDPGCDDDIDENDDNDTSGCDKTTKHDDVEEDSGHEEEDESAARSPDRYCTYIHTVSLTSPRG